jgi:hypothetical protein
LKLIKKNIFLALLIIFVAVSPYFILNTFSDEKNIEKFTSVNFIKYPPAFSFSGEEIELHDTMLIKHFYTELLGNTYLMSNKKHLHKRAEKYFPIIEDVLRKYNIPADFKYVPLIESNFIDTVESRKGAKGYWQLMPTLATEFGLIVNDSIDERTDLKKSTEVICKFLNQSHKKFNSWIMALASLNYGIEGLQKVLDKQQLKTKVISTEANTYLFRLLVYKESFEHPEFYGINK